MEAGASSFIGTLWSINDQSALRFSQELYSKLLNGAFLGIRFKIYTFFNATAPDEEYIQSTEYIAFVFLALV
jgi:hypothetical protein